MSNLPPVMEQPLSGAAITPDIENDVRRRIVLAISRLSLQHSFFAQILFSCTRRPSEQVPTMGVGGTGKYTSPVSLMWNTAFINNLPEDGNLLYSILVHEATHIALGHILKSVSASLDQNVWRTACEYSANKVALITGPQVLKDSSTFTPITLEGGNAALGRQVFLKSDDTLTYYAKLMELSSEERAACSAGTEMEVWGNLIDGMDETEVRSMIKRAAAQAGSVPAELQLELGEFLDPKVRWEDELRDAMGRNISSLREVTPYRIHKRMPFVYPGNKLKPKLDVCIITDTSGSMGGGPGSPLMQAVSEASRIVEMVGGSVQFVCCDAAANVTTVNSATDIKLQGGGGTMLEAAFQAVSEFDTPPSQIVCLTDGYNFGTITDIGIPTVFCVIGGHTRCDGADFGKVILID